MHCKVSDFDLVNPLRNPTSYSIPQGSIQLAFNSTEQFHQNRIMATTSSHDHQVMSQTLTYNRDYT